MKIKFIMMLAASAVGMSLSVRAANAAAEYSCYYRIGEGGAEEVTVTVNKKAELGKKYFFVIYESKVAVSPDKFIWTAEITPVGDKENKIAQVDNFDTESRLPTDFTLSGKDGDVKVSIGCGPRK